MVAVHPNQLTPYVLACDRREPRSRQLRLFLRNLTREQWQRYEKLRDETYLRGLPAAELLAEVFADLRLLIAGWTGARGPGDEPLAYSPERLEEALAPNEAWELYWAGGERSSLTDDDRKNFGLPPAWPAATTDPAPAADAEKKSD